MSRIRKKHGVRIFNKSEKDHTRDFWLVEYRHSHMVYVAKNKKKIIERKRKYKNIDEN